MQKKINLILLVTALSSFVPSYGLGTKAGARKRKQAKMQQAQIQSDAVLSIDSIIVPSKQNDSIITPPVKFTSDDQVVGLTLEEELVVKNTDSDDQGDTTKNTSTVDNSKATKQVMLVAGLRTFASSLLRSLIS